MKNILKIFIAITMFSLNAFADAPTTAEPAKPVCQLTHEVTNWEGNVTTQPNPACQREWSVYNAVKSEYDKAKANGQQTNYAGLKEPTKPANRNCSSFSSSGEPGMSSQQQSCLLDEQRDLKAYNDQKLRYDLQKQALDQAAATRADAEAKRLSSASEGYNDLSEKNQKGSVIYQVASVAAGLAGAYYLKAAMACSIGCTPLYAKAAVAFGIMGIAMSQSGRMDNAGYQACQASNQTSSTQVACGTAPASDLGNVYDPSNPKNPLSNLGPDGKCLPSAPPDCNDKIQDAANRAGLKIVDIKGVNGFAGDKLKIGRDGTVTFPDGKKMNLADLMTANGMQQAGLSASESAALMKQFGINGGTVANLDAEKALKELNHAKPIDGFGDGGGSSSIQTSASILNGAATNKNEKRKPAAEGLTRDFNGERIGAAGDDIFGMMNRRYQLKTSQDTFIGQ